MRKKNIKRISIVLVFLILFQIMSNLFTVLAASIGQSKNLERGALSDYIIQYNNGSYWTYVSSNIVTYKDSEDINRVAYCVTPNIPGIEWVKDNSAGYTVKLTKVLSDARLWRVIKYGYPYVSASELGVETDDDAYLATKLAIQCIKANRPLNQVKVYFRAGQDPVAGLKLTDIQRRGEKVLDAIYNLVDQGYNGTETPIVDNMININKIGSFELDKDANFFSQSYSVTTTGEMSTYEISSLNDFPKGTYTADFKGNKKTIFNSNEQFKIMIPKDEITTNINGRFSVKAKCKTYQIYYGEAPEGWQDYAVCQDAFGEVTSSQTLNAIANNGEILIKKTDSETSKPIEGVTFHLTKSDGKLVAEATTNKEGKAYFKNLFPGKYKLKEINTNKDYVLNNVSFDVNVEFGKTIEKNITNTKKTGNLKIYKVDKDNNKIGIGNVEFELYSEELDKIIGSYTTDVNGEIKVDNLRIGKYKIIEKNSNKWYNLTEEKEIEIEWNKTKEITIENELKKGQIKVIKVDKDDNEIKLAGVKFDVLDKNGNVLETIVTDNNGEAVTSKYPVRDFEKLTLKETETNKEYVVSQESQTVELKENEITSIKFENEKIKGYVEIKKVSSNDNKLTGEEKGTLLKNAVFEIYNENDELVDTVITNENGKGTSKLLEYGKYYIKEKSTGSDYYLLNTKKYKVEIKENLATIPVTIENESVDTSLCIDKTGVVKAQANDEIKYSFNSLKNTSNVALDNFTWTDNLPYNYIRITKLFTGTYNEDLDYTVKYKTNKSEDYVEFGKYNTQLNNYVDFTKINLSEDEVVTDFKVEFGTVKSGFEAVDKPFIFAQVLPTVKAEDKWTNHTNLTGNYKQHKVEDKAEWTTKSNAKKVTIKKLPKTGF